MLRQITTFTMLILLVLSSMAYANPDAVYTQGGDLRIKGLGNGLVFPDGSIQTKACPPLTLAAICDVIRAGGQTLPAFCQNTPPVANAGTNQNVNVGSLVTLNGSGSSDADGDTITYKWSFSSKPSGSTAILTSSIAVNPSFTPDIAGAYVLNLVVNDGKVDSIVSTSTVTAIAPVGTLYTYIGNSFTKCSGTYCTGGPYALKISFTTTMSGSELTSLSFTDINNTVKSFTVSDGSGLVITQNTVGAYSRVSITTDPSGNITGWLTGGYSSGSNIQLQSNYKSPYGFGVGSDFSETTSSFAGSWGQNLASPGVWTLTPAY